MNKKNTWKMLGAASALLLQLTLSTACTSSGNTNSQEAQTEVTQDEMQALAAALPKYSNVDNFHDGLAAVCDRQTELWGFIDKSGKEVIPCQYQYIVSDFQDGVAIVCNSDNTRQIIDREGKSSHLSTTST